MEATPRSPTPQGTGTQGPPSRNNPIRYPWWHRILSEHILFRLSHSLIQHGELYRWVELFMVTQEQRDWWMNDWSPVWFTQYNGLESRARHLIDAMHRAPGGRSIWMLTRFLEWCQEHFGLELHMETNDRLAFFSLVIPTRSMDLLWMFTPEEPLAHLSIHLEKGAFHGMGYVHYIRKGGGYNGRELLTIAIERAHKEGCTELHLQDSSLLPCEEEDRLEISFKLWKVLAHGQTWYEWLGFTACHDSRPRVAPSYLPWKAERRAQPPVYYQRACRVVHEFPLSPWQQYLERMLETASRSEKAQLWSPIYGYLRSYQAHFPKETRFGSFLHWLYKENCIVYQWFQVIWLDPDPDHTVHRFAPLVPFLRAVLDVLLLPYYRGRCEEVLQRLRRHEATLPTPPLAVEGRATPLQLSREKKEQLNATHRLALHGDSSLQLETTSAVEKHRIGLIRRQKRSRKHRS